MENFAALREITKVHCTSWTMQNDPFDEFSKNESIASFLRDQIASQRTFAMTAISAGFARDFNRIS